MADSVHLAGTDLRALSPVEVAQRLSLVLTATPPLDLMNGYALVALGRLPHTDWLGRLTEEDHTAVNTAIDAADAKELADRQVGELSDGQRQKLMVARALAQESEIMLLDEPTAYLDLPRRVETMQLLKRLAHATGRAILVSTHDLDLALRSCDHLWLLSAGGIEIGAPEDLVLAGSLSATFARDGVSFDERSGAFVRKPTHGRSVCVPGDTTHAIWMRRALERAGYAPTAARTPSQFAELKNGNGSAWQLRMRGNMSAHNSIQEVLDALEGKERMTARHARRGLVLVNTGDGRGKSTSAFGVILRMLGRGKKVALIQFLKHEGGQWGEVRALRQLGLEPIKTGDGFTWTSRNMDETQARALHGWELAQAAITSDVYDLVVLDEFTYLMEFGWLDAEEVITWLNANKPDRLHLLITGRNASDALIDYADTVSEMVKIKHTFDVGIKARAGIEF